MTYSEAVRYLLTLGRELAAPAQPAAAKFDLENIRMLAKRLGNPQQAYPSVHIAGTNGKGSTAAMLESILRTAGLRTGLYTSPHLESINERIRVASEPISDEDFAVAFSVVHRLIESMLGSGELRAHPTYFECLTAMAFEHFAHAGVDFAVFEAGLGGRLDATNIVIPEVSVITQVDFDHEAFLGHSIAEIAAEKAGILKPGIPAVSAAERLDARQVIAKRAAELGCGLVEVDAAYRVENEISGGGCFRATIRENNSERSFDVGLTLPGSFQLRNALAAVAAARVLATRGFEIADSAISRGLSSVRWPGRLEKLQERPAVYLDGAHNPAGARELAAFWDEELAGRRIHLVYGALRDKAVDEVAGILFPRAATVVLTEPPTVRAISARHVAEMTNHLAARVEVIAEPDEALERALEFAAPSDAVFVAGSLYLVGALRRSWFMRAQAGKN